MHRRQRFIDMVETRVMASYDCNHYLAMFRTSKQYMRTRPFGDCTGQQQHEQRFLDLHPFNPTDSQTYDLPIIPAPELTTPPST